MQEALVHLWHTEARRPGQTRSWYVQSCRFHVRHYLASGRSVDSVKRGFSRWQPAPAQDRQAAEEEVYEAGQEDSVLNHVGARDLFALLSARLGACERAVLAWLVEGRTTREIGRRLGISHTMVTKHRQKIATLLARLDGPCAALLANGAGLIHRPVNGAGHKNGNGAPHRQATDANDPMNSVLDPRRITVLTMALARRAT